jgi:hypothetical protein
MNSFTRTDGIIARPLDVSNTDLKSIGIALIPLTRGLFAIIESE